MTSRRHYFEKYRYLFYTFSYLVRGVNVPDIYLTPDELAMRRQLEALKLRIAQKDQRKKRGVK